MSKIQTDDPADIRALLAEALDRLEIADRLIESYEDDEPFAADLIARIRRALADADRTHISTDAIKKVPDQAQDAAHA